MSGVTKLMTAGGGGVSLTPASSIASDVTVNVPSQNCTLGIQGPAFSAYLSTTQSISAGTETKVNLDTEDYDTANCFATGRFTPNVAGYYQINATVGCNGSGITAIVAMIKKNGTTIRTTVLQATVNPTTSAFVADTIYCNGTTDYIEMYGLIGGSSGLNFGSGRLYTGMSGFLARAA